MVKKLMLTEVKYGLLYVSELRDLFPEPSSSVTIIDSDGQRFESKMHSFQPRIDGLTKLHRKHNSQVGQTVTVEVSPNEKATAHVLFEETPVEPREPDDIIITPPLESILEDFIANNLGALEPGLQLFRDKREFPDGNTLLKSGLLICFV